MDRGPRLEFEGERMPGSAVSFCTNFNDVIKERFDFAHVKLTTPQVSLSACGYAHRRRI